MSNTIYNTTMKTRNIFVILTLTLGLFITACQDTPRPAVTLLELGYENSGIAYAGSDLHMELEIVAEGTIETVQVTIHHEGEHAKSASSVQDEDEWEVDTTYTKFSGLKNTTFHEHIDVPVHAEIGDYHFHLIVTDMEGRQSSVEEELEIQHPDDAVAPEITIAAAPGNNQEFSNGETITISGSVSDDKALGGMYIGLVRLDQGLGDAEVNATNTITLSDHYPVVISY